MGRRPPLKYKHFSPSSKHTSKHTPPVTVTLAAEKEEREFTVVFLPHTTKKCQGELHLHIVDNQFENLSVQLVGEGYEEMATLQWGR